MSSPTTKDLVYSILQAGQIWRERARAESNLTDCSFLHLHTLHYLETNGAASMKDVANFLHITPPSATSLVNSLVRRGFLSRVNNESDRRVVKLALTKTGRSLLQNSFKRMLALVEKNINRLSETEKKTLLAIIKKIS